MADNKIVGYKNIFGFVLPDWVDEALVRTMVTFLLSASVMLFVLIFVIWPKFTIISQLRISAESKQSQLESLISSKTGFDKLNEQIPGTSQTLILKAIPQAYSPENAIFMLRNLSNEAGVSIVSYQLPSGVLFDTEKPVQNEKGASDSVVKFISYPIKLSVTAPVASLLAFVKKIEQAIPFGVVSDLGMQEVSKLSNSVSSDKSVKMELEVKYYQAVLKRVDISKILPFTEKDMALVKEIQGYTQASQTSMNQDVPSVTNSTGSLFGF